MKKILILVLVLFSQAVWGITMGDLFNALKKQPISKVDILSVKEADMAKKVADRALYPKLYGVMEYNHYNRPSSLRPVLPTETPQLLKEGKPLPFSKDITKIGITFDFPLFVKSLYTIRKKSELVKLSIMDKQKLNLIQREAKILGANANLKYLEKLKEALESKKESLVKIKEDISIKTKNGRLAPIALNKIEQSLNNIKFSENKIEQNRLALISLIETLTGIRVKKSVDFYQVKEIDKKEIFALKPLNKVLKAKKYGIKASKEALYPALFLNANYFENYAKGYNNDKSLNEGFGTIGLKVVMPLFDSSKLAYIQKAKVAYEKEKILLSKTRNDFLVKAKNIEDDIKILKKSEEITKRSIKNQKELLKVAKVAFKNERMSEEEYLRYEDALTSLIATLEQTKAKIWQDIAELAVIYGNDLEGVLR